MRRRVREAMDELLEVLRKHIDGQLAEEGIEPHIIDAVDLEISYSPVIQFRGGGLSSAVDVRTYGFFPRDVLPDRFDVCGTIVDRESLKIMRARYLIALGNHYGPRVRAWDQRFHGAQ